MKKIVLLLSMFFCVISLFAQEATLKFYLNDGNFKSFNIDDIDSLAVLKSDSKYVQHIYFQDTNIAYYPNEIIQCVKIEKDTNKQLILNVYIFNYPKSYIVSDIDSIVFKIDKWQPLTIGSQVWMLKNLDVDHYRNGDSIPEVRDSTEWVNLTSGAWCYYNHEPENGEIYGKLYNGFVIRDTRNLAPIGWHIPSEKEWRIFTPNLNLYGGKLKEMDTLHWRVPNEGATNEFGFSAIPGGGRHEIDGHFFNIFHACFFWSSEEWITKEIWSFSMFFNDAKIWRGLSGKNWGHSVRCIKD